MELRETIINKLKTFNPLLTTKDRADIRKELNFSKLKLSTYLNGQVRDLDEGIRLLEFISERMDKKLQIVKKL